MVMRVECDEAGELWVDLIDAEASELTVKAMAGELLPFLLLRR
jgi:hypothetical protein